MTPTERKKIYNRNRRRIEYEEYKYRRSSIMKILGDECFLCKKKAQNGFHLHHLIYCPIESNYPRHSKSMSVRLKRLAEAEKNPERFLLLCAKHHLLIECVKASHIDLERLKMII